MGGGEMDTEAAQYEYIEKAVTPYCRAIDGSHFRETDGNESERGLIKTND